jgi:hypothetical protein
VYYYKAIYIFVIIFVIIFVPIFVLIFVLTAAYYLLVGDIASMTVTESRLLGLSTIHFVR